MKKHYFFVPLICGIFNPSGMIFLLQVFVAGKSPLFAIKYILRRQFTIGNELFMTMFFSSIPFIALIIIIWLISLILNEKRVVAFIYCGGILPLVVITFFGHFAIWYPLYSPNMHAPSTSVIAIPFIFFYCLVSLPAGLFIGWIVSLFFGETKESEEIQRN